MLASIDGTTLSACCSCGLPLRCLDFATLSSNQFICSFAFFLSLCAGTACNSHQHSTEAHKMCCNSKSTSERSRSPTDEAFTLLVENASFGPNVHTPRTVLLFRHKDRGEVQIEQKTQSMAPLPVRGKAWTRPDSTSPYHRYRKRLVTERNAMQRT